MNRVERVVDRLPEGFAALRSEADAEGFRNMTRLADDWASGTERFTDPGALFAAYDADTLAGVGGVTREPSDPALLRMRRFYVRPAFRRRGHGEALVRAVLDLARGHVLLVHSSDVAMPFWDAAGFGRSTRPGITHERAVGAGRR
jgi:GNAT superfamily N-acetyltransferase